MTVFDQNSFLPIFQFFYKFCLNKFWSGSGLNPFWIRIQQNTWIRIQWIGYGSETQFFHLALDHPLWGKEKDAPLTAGDNGGLLPDCPGDGEGGQPGQIYQEFPPQLYWTGGAQEIPPLWCPAVSWQTPSASSQPRVRKFHLEYLTKIVIGWFSSVPVSVCSVSFQLIILESSDIYGTSPVLEEFMDCTVIFLDGLIPPVQSSVNTVIYHIGSCNNVFSVAVTL
jgi:hypothetical protein